MSQLEKLLQKIKNNPKTVKFEELEKILKKYGFKCRQPRGGSSHYTFYTDDGKMITIPKHLPYIKEQYVKQSIKMLEV